MVKFEKNEDITIAKDDVSNRELNDKEIQLEILKSLKQIELNTKP